MKKESFEYYIARALESIPEEFIRHLDNVEIMGEDSPPRELQIITWKHSPFTM
jgi:hypothetical protein